MNGIQFIVRDRSGWVPPIRPPLSRFKWTDPKPRKLTAKDWAFIREAKGTLNSIELADQFEVTPQAIRNIWRGKRTGRPPGRPRKQTSGAESPPSKTTIPKVPA